MSETMKATIVRINVEHGKAGLYYATSPDLKGLLVAEASEDELYKEIPVAIGRLYLACGESVLVIPTENSDDELRQKTWVKLPMAITKALEVTH